MLLQSAEIINIHGEDILCNELNIIKDHHIQLCKG